MGWAKGRVKVSFILIQWWKQTRIITRILPLLFLLTVDPFALRLTLTMPSGNVSMTYRPMSQCLQPSILKHNTSIALGRPNSTQGWNCLFIISIIVGLWKMALIICSKMEEVIFLSKCVLMMCCLMECRIPAIQSAGNSALLLRFFFVSFLC